MPWLASGHTDAQARVKGLLMPGLKDQPHDYVPQAGTIAAKAILALYLVDNCRLSSAAMLDACGQPTSYPGLSTIMNLSMHHGLVERKRDGHLTFWELTKKGLDVAKYMAAQGTESASSAVEKPEVEARQERPAVPGSIGDIPVFARQAALRDAAPREVEQPDQQDAARVFRVMSPPGVVRVDSEGISFEKAGAAEPEVDGFECALTSAGRLVIHADGKQFALTAEHTTALFAHTDKARGIDWEGGA